MSLFPIEDAIFAADYDRAMAALADFSPPADQPYLGYWYEGLCHLLQGDEETAQGIWFSTLLELPEEITEIATQVLCDLLHRVAEYHVFQEKHQEAWLIRQYLGELNPDYFNNRFALLELDDRLGLLDSLEERGQDILSVLMEQGSFNASPLSLAYSLVIFETHESLKTLLEADTYLDFLLQFVENYPTEKQTLKQALIEFVSRRLGQPDRCLDIAEILEQWSQGDFPTLSMLIPFYHSVDQYEKAIVTSEHFLDAADRLEDEIAGLYMLLQSLLKSGVYFDRAKTLHGEYLDKIRSLLQQSEISDSNTISNLIILLTFLSYLQDTPAENNHLKGQVADRFTQLVQQLYTQKLDSFKSKALAESIAMENALEDSDPETEESETEKSDHCISESSAVAKSQDKVIRIGYISECLRRHSIGYLVRDLFRYHDRSEFEIIAYTFKNTGDPIQNELLNLGQSLKVIQNPEPDFIYNFIQTDQIDILVDLDSLTSKKICALLALKPAPIQISWLGYDAAELPTIDYFFVDSYIVPSQAQTYYREKLWHFPHTYIAVNGFEVGVSPLRRESLDIPPKAVVYFSAQTGYKRNPDNIRQQLKILKAVPDSYFLIKGYSSDLEALKSYFQTLVKAEGVEYDRLRFLGVVPEEETHRAILTLTDIVLDTYPYNGATTTLEALWLGIPIVTRVGQQFSARTSYSALMNLGITAGLAWSDQDYVDWGIRLGQDAALRQKLSLSLQRAHQTSPLWNPKSFTAALEIAYRTLVNRE